MASSGSESGVPKQPQRRRGTIAFAIVALLTALLAAIVHYAISILRLPQSTLRSFEIIVVSLTGCLLVILLATTLAALLESLGFWLTPKPRSEQWFREGARRHKVGEELSLAEGQGAEITLRKPAA